jgi:hypothetical protein
VIGGAALTLARQRNWLYLDVTSWPTAATPVVWLVQRLFPQNGIRPCDRNTRYWGMIRKSGPVFRKDHAQTKR